MEKGNEFLEKLKKSLEHLPFAEVDRALSYYRESLEDKLEDGLTEKEAVESFGDIDTIVKNIEEEIPLTTVVKDKVLNKTKNNSNVNKVLLGIVIVLTSPLWFAFLATGLFILFGFYALLWSIPVTIGTLYISLYPIAVLGVIFGFIRVFTIDIFTGIAYLGLGIFTAGLAVMFFKPILKGCKLWFKVNIWPFKKLKQYIIRKG